MLDQSAEDFINVLHSVHCDNSKLQYYAEGSSGKRVPMMPLTPFVYEFFLFNSLYQVDWNTSNEKNELIFHPKNDGEFTKQKALLNFIKPYAKNKPAYLYRAFEPLLYIERTEGSWTQVTPGSKISTISDEDGKKFFRDILELQTILKQCKNPSDIPTNKNTFDILRECTRFINNVRNNIFHGSKKLDEARGQNQKRRIEVYELFLKGLTSLFFLASGRNTAACDFMPCPIFSSSLPTKNTDENTNKVVDQSSIFSAIANSIMKPGDSRLVARFTKIVPPPAIDVIPSEKSSLFYPSADKDFITPILLGLPYCTQFYFFEISHRNGKSPPNIIMILKGIKGVETPSHPPYWKSNGERQCLDFKFNGVDRRLHWVHADNKTFLQEDVELKFYFHRGDSMGEGGSGQEWDSKLLPELLRLIPTNSSCIYLTDGAPGGFDTQHSYETFELNAPFIERARKYYCGRFSPIAANVQPIIPAM